MTDRLLSVGLEWGPTVGNGRPLHSASDSLVTTGHLSLAEGTCGGGPSEPPSTTQRTVTPPGEGEGVQISVLDHGGCAQAGPQLTVQRPVTVPRGHQTCLPFSLRQRITEEHNCGISLEDARLLWV